jgi:hypothetical protein
MGTIIANSYGTRDAGDAFRTGMTCCGSGSFYMEDKG